MEENINKLSRPNFNKGNLMVYQKRYDEYVWVIYLNKETGSSNRHNIIYKDGENYEIKSVFSGSLFGYPENENVLPESKKNMKYDEYNIYETYNLDNM